MLFTFRLVRITTGTLKKEELMKMTKEQVVNELETLIAGFEEVHNACPVCLYEAVRLLKEGDKDNG